MFGWTATPGSGKIGDGRGAGEGLLGRILETDPGNRRERGGDRRDGRPRRPVAAAAGPLAPPRYNGRSPPALQGGRGQTLLHREREIGAVLGGLLLLLPVPPVESRHPEIPADRRGGDGPGRPGGEGPRSQGVLDRVVGSCDAQPRGARTGGERHRADPVRGGERDGRGPRAPVGRGGVLP